MKIGIIGTGTIASAIVTGFCTQKAGHEFFLSPRNADKAAALAAKFSEVKVCQSNQDVLDKAEWVFITVQKNAFGALNELKFRKDHKVLNMATEMQLDDLKKITGETALLAHVVPLPMIVRGFGPLLVYPEIPEVGQLFAPVSDAIYLKKLSDMRPLQLLTCMMSPYYMLLEEFVRFAESQGISHDVSVKFTHSLLSALSRRAAETANCDLVELAHDMTPGGYNEQSMNELMNSGAIAAWRTTLNRLSERLLTSL
ncbi:MAG: NAD(P)-binding domain-containing protein [Bacteroidales bacterium]|jgi:pyrroline-5-carboxylate reductase|nr:NAD(P)-binding domain-containing protein [Bacteroidales bacterium]